jgi:predicted nucleic acid-binding protein
MRVVLDTRFFVETFASDDEQFKKWARTTLQTLQAKTNLGVVPSIVILEFYKIQLENLGKAIADLRTNTILKSDLKITNLDPPIAIEAAKLRCKYAELPTADVIIAATSVTTSCDYIITDDKHIKQIKEIKTKWI